MGYEGEELWRSVYVRLRAVLMGNGLGRTLAVCLHFSVGAGGGSLDFTD